MSPFKWRSSKPLCDHEWVESERFYLPTMKTAFTVVGGCHLVNLICPKCEQTKQMKANEWDAIRKWKSGEVQGVKIP